MALKRLGLRGMLTLAAVAVCDGLIIAVTRESHWPVAFVVLAILVLNLWMLNVGSSHERST